MCTAACGRLIWCLSNPSVIQMISTLTSIDQSESISLALSLSLCLSLSLSLSQHTLLHIYNTSPDLSVLCPAPP